MTPRPRDVRAARTIVAAAAVLLLAGRWAAAEQSQRPLPGTYTLGDGPVPSVCVEEGVSLALEPTVYTSAGPSLRVRREHEGTTEDVSLQEAIDAGLLVCRSRSNGQLGLVFERKQPGEYVLTVPADAPAVVARSHPVRERIEPLVTQALPRVPDGLSAKELEAFADQVNRAALSRRGPQQDQWRQLREAGLRELRAASAAAGGGFTVRQEGGALRLVEDELVIPARPVFRDLLDAFQIVQWLGEDAELKAAAAKWPELDEELVAELRRLKGHALATAVEKPGQPGAVWLRVGGLPDIRLPHGPPDAVVTLPAEWTARLADADLVIDMTGVPEGTDASAPLRAAAAIRRAAPGAKVLLATRPGWQANLRRLWAGGPAPVGVVVQPDSLGEGFGEIHNQLVGMFDGFERLGVDARFGVVPAPAGKPRAIADLAAEVRKSRTLGGVTVEGRQWLVIACRPDSGGGGGGAPEKDVDDLVAALSGAGAAQVIRPTRPMNGLAATAAIGELFTRLDAAEINPIDVVPDWLTAQRDARRILLEIRPSAEAPQGAVDLLKNAAEQLAAPDATTAASL